MSGRLSKERYLRLLCAKNTLRHPKAESDGFIHAVSTDTDREAVLKELKTGPYGRCVFPLRQYGGGSSGGKSGI